MRRDVLFYHFLGGLVTLLCVINGRVYSLDVTVFIYKQIVYLFYKELKL